MNTLHLNDKGNILRSYAIQYYHQLHKSTIAHISDKNVTEICLFITEMLHYAVIL